MGTSITEIFRECHRLRRHLRELQQEIDLGPRVLKAKQTWLDQEKALHQEAHDAIKRLKLKQKEDEGTLKQVEGLLDKLSLRAMQVTTMKEMEATRAETATATARKAELEDAILAAMTEIEERTARLPQDDRRWAETQAEFKQFEIDAKERYERLVEDQKLTNEKLVECDKHIPADIKPQYDRLIRTYGPDGLAGVKANFCQQCRLKLTDQQLFNLQRGKFMCCPQCGRALYPMD